MTTPTEAAAQAQASRDVLAARDRLAFRTTGARVHVDTRLAQLQRCLDKAQAAMDQWNAFPAYLGSNPKKVAAVRQADWAAHNAMLRRDWAQAQIQQLTQPAA